MTKRQYTNKQITKKQHDKKAERQKDKRQRPKREFNIVTSGQFRTLAMFYFTAHECMIFLLIFFVFVLSFQLSDLFARL